MLVPEGNDGGLPVSHGGPILEDARYKYVLQLLRDRTEADRAILSIGVVSFIRALMVELGELCHEASLQMIDLDEAEPEPEDTVEVEVDEEDGNGLVQTTMNLVKQDTGRRSGTAWSPGCRRRWRAKPSKSEGTMPAASWAYFEAQDLWGGRRSSPTPGAVGGDVGAGCCRW